jgi:hypothetical protein
MGRQSFGPFVQTGFPIEQQSLFDQLRAFQTRGALESLLASPNDRFGPLLKVLEPETLWTQLTVLVSRLVTADMTSIATVIAWTIAALVVWSATRLLRTFFDTLLQRVSWFALYVFAQSVGTMAGASILFLLFITWGPLSHAAGRPAQSVLLLAAVVGGILSTAAAVIISATERPERVEEAGPALAARRVPVR